MRSDDEIHADLDVAVPEKMAAPHAWGRWAATQERLAGDVPALLVGRDAARGIATQLEQENAQLRIAVEAVRAEAVRWRNVTPVGFYPEALAYANATENCGDALIDLLDEHPVAAAGGVL